MRKKERSQGLWGFQELGGLNKRAGLPRASTLNKMMGEGGRRTRGGRGLLGKRWFWQATACVALLAMIITVFALPGERAARTQQVIKRYVVEDYGLTPVFSFMDAVMTWGDVTEKPESFELPAAAQVSLPTDGRMLSSGLQPEGPEAQGTAAPVQGADGAASGEEAGRASGPKTAEGDQEGGEKAAADGEAADKGIGKGSETKEDEKKQADEIAIAAGALADDQGIWIETEAGSSIRAAMDGKISDLGKAESGVSWFVLDSGLGWTFRYSHCQDLQIAQGDQVKQGQLLGKTANVRSAGDGEDTVGREVGRLYVQVYYKGRALDPAAFFLGGH
ncbi:MAG: peptidoglycan DD-metalloendopeptidase family protein [Clostridiales bacterium]